MFEFLFGWRKASKCKKLIKQVQCRLQLLKNKRCAIAKQFRDDIVQLLKNGYQQTAFNRVDQLMKDESAMAAYELLDNFCQFILLNLSYIRKHKDCPNDVNEAVSSLMYASARCGDLPELQLIRKIFGERYGHRFETTAVELCPGNLVNPQIKEKLSTVSVSDDEKYRMIQKIVRDCLQPELLALEYHSDWHQNQVLLDEVQSYDDQITERPIKPVLNADESKRKDIHVDSLSCSECWQPSEHMLNSPKDNKKKKMEYAAANCSANCRDNRRTCTVTLEHEEKRKNSASSCESLPQLPDEKIVYLDDVVELTREGDQRLFKFKPPALLKTGRAEDGFDQNYMDRSEESRSETENSSLKRCRKSRSESGRRSRRRSESMEMRRTKDIECVSYSLTNGGGPSDKEKEWAYFYKKQRSRRTPSCDIKSAAYDIFTYPGSDCDIKHKEFTGKTPKYNTVKNSEKLQSGMTMNEGGVRNKSQRPYLRAVTLPQERGRDGGKGGVPRTNSFPNKHPNHVHPKLPEYEDIAAKFMALKRQHQQNNGLKS